MKVILIVVKIFVIAALLIISNQSLAISDSSNRQHFVDEYSVWISHLVERYSAPFQIDAIDERTMPAHF